MKARSIALALAFTAALATPALAGDHSADDQMGVGLTPCTDFLKMAQKAPVNEIIFYSWAQGFISAANRSRLMQGGDSVNVGAISQEAQRRQLRTYCRAHPLTEYMFAVADLINSMPTNPGSAAAAEAFEGSK